MKALATFREDKKSTVIGIEQCPQCMGDGYTVEQGCCGNPMPDGSCCGNAIAVQQPCPCGSGFVHTQTYPCPELRKEDDGKLVEVELKKCDCKIGNDCPYNKGQWISPCTIAILIKQKDMSVISIIIKEGLQFTVPNDNTIFKIKCIIGEWVTVSWFDNGERTQPYEIGIVRLNFATNTWIPVAIPIPAGEEGEKERGVTLVPEHIADSINANYPEEDQFPERFAALYGYQLAQSTPPQPTAEATEEKGKDEIKYLNVDGTIYVRKDVTEDSMVKFVKKLLDDGKISINAGHDDYFKTINGAPTDMFLPHLPNSSPPPNTGQAKDVGELQEECRQYAENKMPMNWDRTDVETVALFYTYYIEYLLQSLPAPIQDQRGVKEYKPMLNERFADNGAHSHWELINPVTGEILWTEDSTRLPENIEQVIKELAEKAYQLPTDKERKKLSDEEYDEIIGFVGNWRMAYRDGFLAGASWQSSQAGKEAIEFAKWVYENEYIYDEESNRWGWNGCQDGQELTSSELYTLFTKK